MAYGMRLLGDCLTTQKRFSEAEPLLIEAHAEFLAELTEIHPSTTKALESVDRLYEKWHKPTRADAFRKKLRTN